MTQKMPPEKLVRTTTSLAELFLRRAGEMPDREAFRYPGPSDADSNWRSMTWRAAAERVRAIAAGLLALGIGREQRVGLLSNTRIEWILCDLGILCAGGATTTVYPSSTDEECCYILTDSATRICFVEDVGQLAKLRTNKAELPDLFKVILIEGAVESNDGWVLTLAELEAKGRAHLAAHPRAIEDVVAGIQGEQLATLIYTSGTTGTPKGVRLVHECWAYTADAIAATGMLGPDDVQYLWLPLSHSFGKVLMGLQLTSGSVSAVDGRIPKLVDNLAIVRPTFMAAAPRIFEKVYNRIVGGVKEQGGMKARIFAWALGVGKRGSQERQAGRKPGGLLALQLRLADRLVFSKIKQRFGGRVRFFVSGAAPLSREIAEFFHACDILILEGYGLTESSAASVVNRPHRYAFGSVGVPMPGTEVKLAPEDGEILLRSPGIMRGYHNLPDLTAESLTPDGWLRTGDIGELDPSGILRVTDRKKDLIKTSGGKYIAPQSIEGKLKAVCPFLSQVLVHGDRRNFCTALVTLDEEAILKWAAENGLASRPTPEIASSSEVRKLLEPFFAEVNRSLAKFETIKNFVILPRDLSVEEGELTPSLKVKRKAVETKYKGELDRMYEGAVADL